MLGQPIAGEEELRISGAKKEAVVVEVEIPVAESGNMVKLRLDGVGIENGEHIGIREDVSMVDNRDLGVIDIQPCRYLLVRDDEDVPDPGCVVFGLSKGILQLITGGEAGF